MSIEKLKEKVKQSTNSGTKYSQRSSSIEIEGITFNQKPFSVSLKVFNDSVNIKKKDIDTMELQGFE